MPDVPMKSPVTTFLYVLMRDHLPTGTVKYLIEQAQRAGDPAYSAPELEQLAERYATELLAAPPRDVGDAEGGAQHQPEHQPEHQPPTEPKPSRPQRKRTGDAGRASQDTIDAFLDFLREKGGKCKPNAFDELGKSDATRARVLRELRSASKVHVEFDGRQRLIVLTPENCTCKWAPLEGFKPDERDPDLDCPAHPSVTAPDDEDAKRVRGAGESPPASAGAEPVDDEAGESPASTSEPDPDDAGEGFTPDDPAGDTEDEDHDEVNGASAAADEAQPEHRGSDGDGRESGSAAGVAQSEKPSDSDGKSSVLEAAAKLIDEADGDVWPHELETALGIGQHLRLQIVEKLKSEKRLTILAPRSPNVRYRSTKQRRSAPAAGRSSEREAAEPLGSGPLHLDDQSQKRKADAVREAEQAAVAASKVLPAVREWVRGASTFNPRQLRDVFDLEPAVGARVLATLTAEGAIERAGEDRADVYQPVRKTVGGNGRGGNGKRPLDAERATLESRVLGALRGGDGRTLRGVMGTFSLSEETAKAILGKLYREGEARPKTVNGELHYTATA